ncbi:MAG TPA: hypothetical protein ENN64_00875 [bacterium]|nr:hypothetical protein [bacterium]
MKKSSLKEKRYQGQALAIILIILIVGVILALALYSRNVKNKYRTVDEKRSREAAQEVDAIIGVLQSSSRIALISNVETRFPVGSACWNTDEGCCVSGESDVTQILNVEDVDLSSLALSPDDSPSTLMEVCFQYVNDFSTGFTIHEGSSFAINLFGESKNCELDFSFTGNPIVVHQVYAQKDASGKLLSFREYTPNDTQSLEGDFFGLCVDSSACGSRWIDMNEFSFSCDEIGGYVPYELRFIASPGPTIMTINASNDCVQDLALRVTPKSTSSGNFKGSYFDIPLRDSSPSLFDYVLYNNGGELLYDD